MLEKNYTIGYEEEILLYPPVFIIFAYKTDWKSNKTISDNIKEIVNDLGLNYNEVFDFIYIMQSGITLSWSDPKIEKYMLEHEGGLSHPSQPMFLPFLTKKSLQEYMILSTMQISQKGVRKKNFEVIQLDLEHQLKGFLRFVLTLNQILFEEIKITITSILFRIWNYNNQRISTSGHSSTIWGDVFKKHGKY